MIIGVRDDREDVLILLLFSKSSRRNDDDAEIKGKIGPAGQILMTTDENHNTILSATTTVSMTILLYTLQPVKHFATFK